jgi:hypothetical protein
MEKPFGRMNCEFQKKGRIDPAIVMPTGGSLYPTSRDLRFTQDQDYAEEWAEPAWMPDGTRCLRIYLFTAEEVNHKDAADYPWDDRHIARILLVDNPDRCLLCGSYGDQCICEKEADR